MLAKKILPSLILALAILVQFLPLPFTAPKPVEAVTYCDWAQFIADVTIPDGTSFSPGQTFTKTWRLKNIGTCTWTTSYALVFASGDQLSAPAAVNLPASVAPGATIDVSVNMTAPASAGHYRGYWKLRNASGVLFGIGSTASSSFWVDINVTSTTTTVYDFVANFCSATWTSGAGILPCPGTSGDTRGYVQKVDNPKYENGVTDTQPGLLVAPQYIWNGFIQGIYPAVTIQSGDRFQALVNCQYGASSCYVTFRLDYQIGSGPVQTFWSFKERYEGLYYRVDKDLSSLAGQTVKFILYLNAAGTASGDRAMWGYPRIIRSSPTITSTPSPTNTPPSLTPTTTSTPTSTITGTPPSPTPTRTPTSTATLSSACDRAAFITDVTIPDGTSISPGTAFTKTWRLRNEGTCTWTTAYKLVFVSGDALGAITINPLAASVAPGATVDLSVNMTAPTAAGHYRGYWKLQNASGGQFGIGVSGTSAFYVDINVSSTYTTIYDFYTQACTATWTSSAGALPCPGTDGDANGFILKLEAPVMEDGSIGQPGLLTVPQNVYNGWIQGIYPALAVQSGDRFLATINCQSGATSCLVTYKLYYQVGAETPILLRTLYEKYEGMYYRVDVDLNALVGKTVKFILYVNANGSATGDRALWVAPRIARTP